MTGDTRSQPMSDPDIEAACEDITKGLKTHRGCSPGSADDPAALIDARLADLAEANAIYDKDQRLGAPDKIARNNREISWLKDLRSIIVTGASAQGWLWFATAPRDGTKITAWHKVWKCPVTISYFAGRRSDCKWVEGTLTTEWPDEAFTHWQPLLTAPTVSSTNREAGK